MDRILREAVVQGLLAPDAAPSPADARHWSVVAFTAIAAWFVAIPLFAVVLGLASLMGRVESMGTLLGLPLLVVSVLMLRRPQMPLFAEHIALPGLLAGAGLLGFYLFSGNDSASGLFAMLLLIACAVAVLVRQIWLRTLMGTAIGLLASAWLLATAAHTGTPMSPRLPWSLVSGLWLGLLVVQRAIGLDARSAARVAGLEAVSSGMATAALMGAIWSSPTFLVGTLFGGTWAGSLLHDLAPIGWDGRIARGVSVAFALGGGVWLAVRWTVLRTAWYAALLGLCALLAWCLPALGAVLLIMFVCVESRRHALASFAGVAAAWLIGGLYYDLAWPLAHKAWLLIGIGVAVALIARFAVAPPAALAEPAPLAEPGTEPLPGPARAGRRTRIGFLSCAVLVMAVANAAIWQKEHIIATGTTVLVALAPTDPRSLMQGDYMQLRFALLPDARGDGDVRFAHPQLVARIDGRGIATLLRYHDGRAPANGELLIDLVRRNGKWVVVTDAWYFKEGEAARWSKARYGELRVSPDGKALLVGLRGPNLEKL